MGRLERFYKIDQLLQSRRIVSREAFLEELEVSLATFKRDLEYMRDRFNAPVIWDAHERGYRYENANQTGQKFELPGLWFDEREAHPHRNPERAMRRPSDGQRRESACLCVFAPDALPQPGQVLGKCVRSAYRAPVWVPE